MALLALLMGGTGYFLLRNLSLSQLGSILKTVRPGFLLLGVGLMVCYVGCEALASWQILGWLGHKPSLRRCMCYSFVGFYVSSITPSATGGQPSQIWLMDQDDIPVAHGALNMMLIAVCYQVAAVVYGVGVWCLAPGLRESFDGGLALMLLYGGGMMLVLTAGMVVVMFFPSLARRFCLWVLGGLHRVQIIKDREKAQEKLVTQLELYAAGAKCIRENPILVAKLLGLALIQLTALFSVPYAVYLAFGLTGHTMFELVGMQALLTLAVCNIPLPGAVGPAEGGFLAAFLPFFGPQIVAPAMLLSRGISFYTFLVFSAGVTVVVALDLRRRTRQRTLAELRAQRGGRVQAAQAYLTTRGGNPMIR